jgi:hypothetical protein
MTTLTNATVLSHYNLKAELEPTAMDALIDFSASCAPQRQGDVLTIPTQSVQATTPVPAEGVAVVSSEAKQGNTHILHAYAGRVFFDADPAPFKGDKVVYGLLTVAEDAQAVLIHTGEHPALGFAPGNYLVLGQVEGALELRRVMD